jgi:diacylglycerol kinase family enzyme
MDRLLPASHLLTQPTANESPLVPFATLRLLLVVNSFASSVTARNTVIVHRRLARGHHVEVVETNRRGHATRFAQDGARRGVDVVIGYGGDGTLNEVATGIAGTNAALGVLPGGSTNVFARTLGMPNDPVAAVEFLAAGIDHADIRPIGLGLVNGRFFCFHTGIGFDAAVVRQVEHRGSMKRWFGHPLFMYAGLNTWLRGYDRRHPHFSLDSDDGRELDDGFFSIVLNTNPYTYLGNRPLDLSPAATLDQSLVVVTFRTLRASAIIGSLAGALRGGGVKSADHLAEWRDVQQMVVSHQEPFPYQVDGDYLGETNRLEFRHVPEAVRLVFPQAPEPD